MTRAQALAASLSPDKTTRSAATARVIVSGLTLAAIGMLFLISAQRLRAWGIDYESPAGSPLEKIHPGSWAILAALAFASLRAGNPILFFLQAGARWPGVAALFLTWTALVFFVVLFEKEPVTPLVDSFLLPMAVFVLFADKQVTIDRRWALLIHALLVANACLGIVEYLTGWRLTPFWAGELLQIGDWRSTAFLGHPLANASITGAYILALALGGGDDLPKWLRPLIMALQLTSMVAFGGRTALILTIALLGALALWRLAAILRGGPVPLTQAVLWCFAAPLVAGVVLVALQAGFFDRLLYRFVDDYGSAEARVVMFRVFDAFPLRQILFGPDQAWLASLQYQEGINYGIESFWLSFILEHGLLLSVPFFLALAAFSVDLVRATRSQTILLLIYFFAVASTSVSFTAKTSALGLFVVVVMILLRPPSRKSRAC